MNRNRVAALVIFTGLAGLAGGFWIGVREGEYVGELAAAPLRGGFAARALTGIKAGDTKGASLMYESQVDSGLLSLNEFAESPTLRFVGSLLTFNPQSSVTSSVIENSALKMANYRRANPSPFHGEYLTHDPNETPEQRVLIDDALQRHREATQIINSMVERYAPNPGK